MSEQTWEKAASQPEHAIQPTRRHERLKFLIGGLLLLGAVIYLVFSATTSTTQYFMSIDDLMSDPENIGKTVRISGAVIGESIVYDNENLILDFTVANVESETDNLALSLYEAVNNPDATRLDIHIDNEVKPDLLQNEAQAILTGSLGEDGVFYATELLLKCPSRYEETAPDQVNEV